jgi:hypothetical protein
MSAAEWSELLSKYDYIINWRLHVHGTNRFLSPRALGALDHPLFSIESKLVRVYDH